MKAVQVGLNSQSNGEKVIIAMILILGVIETFHGLDPCSEGSDKRFNFLPGDSVHFDRCQSQFLKQPGLRNTDRGEQPPKTSSELKPTSERDFVG